MTELDQALSFLRELWGLRSALERSSKAMERSIGVTGPQRLAVRFIGLYPGIRLGDLAALLCVHPSTLTGIVRRLCDGGYVDRRVDPHDARSAGLWLTDAGARIDAATEGTVEAAVRTALAAAPPDDVERSRALLRAIQRHLDATDR